MPSIHFSWQLIDFKIPFADQWNVEWVIGSCTMWHCLPATIPSGGFSVNSAKKHRWITNRFTGLQNCCTIPKEEPVTELVYVTTYLFHSQHWVALFTCIITTLIQFLMKVFNLSHWMEKECLCRRAVMGWFWL